MLFFLLIFALSAVALVAMQALDIEGTRTVRRRRTVIRQAPSPARFNSPLHAAR